MKKLIYVFLLCGLSTFSFAQDEPTTGTIETPEVKEPKQAKEKVVNNFLPSTGDFAIGVDAVPYVEFLGNMFSGWTGKNTLNLNSTTIFGKYYLSPNSAVRAELFLNNSTNTDMNYVEDNANVSTNPNAQVEDQRVISEKGVGFGVGYQMYRGYGKLRGTYGGVVSYYTETEKTEYKYGNKMNASNTNPTTYNWAGGGTITPAERDLSVISDGEQTISLGLTAGVEYFFVPKVCIGGELGIYYSFSWTRQESRKYETVEQGALREYELATKPGEVYSSFSTNVYNVDNVAGRLYVLFHF